MGNEGPSEELSVADVTLAQENQVAQSFEIFPFEQDAWELRPELIMDTCQ